MRERREVPEMSADAFKMYSRTLSTPAMSAAKIAVLNGIKKWLAIAPYGTPIQLPSSKHIVAFKTPRTDLRYAPERLSQ